MRWAAGCMHAACIIIMQCAGNSSFVRSCMQARACSMHERTTLLCLLKPTFVAYAWHLTTAHTGLASCRIKQGLRQHSLQDTRLAAADPPQRRRRQLARPPPPAASQRCGQNKVRQGPTRAAWIVRSMWPTQQGGLQPQRQGSSCCALALTESKRTPAEVLAPRCASSPAGVMVGGEAKVEPPSRKEGATAQRSWCCLEETQKAEAVAPPHRLKCQTTQSSTASVVVVSMEHGGLARCPEPAQHQ